MKIYFDENMPFVKAFFSSVAELVPFSGRELSSEMIKDADALLVRSITQVNEALISQCERLSFVGSATIGVDHIDLSYLQSKNIPFYSAPGCNAISVAEYVTSALMLVDERYELGLQNKTVGIIGAGNTGTRLSERLDALGIHYMLHDPILSLTDDSRKFVELDEALSADIISLHVPLTRDGEYPTYHLINEDRIKQLAQEQVLINACRGEVIDNKALLSLKKAGHALKLILDVWENEPNVLTELIDYTEIATAHIAGYSLEGKSRGTEMLYQALCREWNLEATFSLTKVLPPYHINHVSQDSSTFPHLRTLMRLIYDVRRDDMIFRQKLLSDGFDRLRKEYPVRRENSALSVSSNKKDVLNYLKPLGFNIIS